MYMNILEFYIDDKLNIGNHIDNTCKKVQQKYGILKKICRYVTQKTAIYIYNVMIMSSF